MVESVSVLLVSIAAVLTAIDQISIVLTTKKLWRQQQQLLQQLEIVDCCVEGNTNSCTLEVEVRENASLVIDMKFEVKEKKVDELQS